MFRYLQNLRNRTPRIESDYVDWVTDRTARALGEDRNEVQAALLGYPHNHEHTSTTLRGITEGGCAGSGQQSALKTEGFAEEHGLHEHKEQPLRFSIVDSSTGTGIVFRILDGTGAFTRYGISHEKDMHLLVVREDLRHFAHIHPTRDGEGTWTIPYTVPAGGTYWLYADFVDEELRHYTIRFDRTYAGDAGDTGFIVNRQRRKHAGPYVVMFEETPYSGGSLFTYHIQSPHHAPGREALLEPYLGAHGHGILVSPKGDFVHTHPSPASDHLTFHVSDPADDIYRVFTQFQIAGEVQTAIFDWEPRRHRKPLDLPQHTH